MVIALSGGCGGPEIHQMLTVTSGYYSLMENFKFDIFLLLSVCNTNK